MYKIISFIKIHRPQSGPKSSEKILKSLESNKSFIFLSTLTPSVFESFLKYYNSTEPSDSFYTNFVQDYLTPEESQHDELDDLIFSMDTDMYIDSEKQNRILTYLQEIINYIKTYTFIHFKN